MGVASCRSIFLLPDVVFDRASVSPRFRFYSLIQFSHAATPSLPPLSPTSCPRCSGDGYRRILDPKVSPPLLSLSPSLPFLSLRAAPLPPPPPARPGGATSLARGAPLLPRRPLALPPRPSVAWPPPTPAARPPRTPRVRPSRPRRPLTAPPGAAARLPCPGAAATAVRLAWPRAQPVRPRAPQAWPTWPSVRAARFHARNPSMHDV
jgi:hypothetical protein